MEYCLLGLGSNQGSRDLNLYQAIQLIQPHISGMLISSIYESQAVLPENAPHTWNLPYLNLAIYGQYIGTLDLLLEITQGIEKYMGRDMNSPKWSPRTIDIDILIFSDLIINSTKITVPHPEMLNRPFVMIPASEIAGHLIHPVTKKSLEDELNSLKISGSNSIQIQKYTGPL